MEPRIWQLKNRIKYVENLRSGRFEEVHSTWLNNDMCGGCAIGIAVLTIEDKSLKMENVNRALYPFIKVDLVNWRNDVISGRKERQLISEYFNFNYLEIIDISNTFENNYRGSGITHSQIADYIEQKHIIPYLYMMGHYKQYKTKIAEELMALV